MQSYKLTIEYDGTRFNGWQTQERAGRRTVQGEIEKALRKIYKKKIRLYGSGRTDSGVHALGQVAHFKSSARFSSQELIKAINGNLPEDIVILSAATADPTFHAQFKAKRKIYRYSILNRTIRCAQQRAYFLYYPFPLNLAQMRKEAKCLIGCKDFKAFMASDRRQRGRERSTMRTVYDLVIKQRGSELTIDIEANGFLYKMVRNIVGTLLEVGRGRRPRGSIKDILSGKNRIRAGETAPAKGLCLVSVIY